MVKLILRDVIIHFTCSMGHRKKLSNIKFWREIKVFLFALIKSIFKLLTKISPFKYLATLAAWFYKMCQNN